MMTLVEAAELGTQKVIKDHSTIAILMTTDASFGEISRENFVPMEERLVRELKEIKKPFVIVLNSKDPQSKSAQTLQKNLEEK